MVYLQIYFRGAEEIGCIGTSHRDYEHDTFLRVYFSIAETIQGTTKGRRDTYSEEHAKYAQTYCNA